MIDSDRYKIQAASNSVSGRGLELICVDCREVVAGPDVLPGQVRFSLAGKIALRHDELAHPVIPDRITFDDDLSTVPG